MVGIAPTILMMDTPVVVPFLTPKKNVMIFCFSGIWGMIGLMMIGTPATNVGTQTKTPQPRWQAVIAAKLLNTTIQQNILRKSQKRA